MPRTLALRCATAVLLALPPLLALLPLLALAACSGGEPKPASSARPSPAATPFPAPATATLDTSKAATLARVLQDVVAEYAEIPDRSSAAQGATAAVVTDRWTWSGAAGVDGIGTALVPTTAMAVASITKTFVAAEVLRLADAGQVKLDAPLSTYVKHPLAGAGTVQQHLAMTAGLADFAPGDYVTMGREITAAPSRHWTPEQALAHYTSARGTPGSPHSYSNPSYLLLGLLIEAVTRQPLATALRRDLVQPAGLARIALQDTERPQPPIATSATELCAKVRDGYLPCRAVASATMGSAGMAADAPTVARWGYQLYGGRVLSPAIVATMTAGDGEYGLGTMRFSQTLGLGDAFGHRGTAPDYTSLLVVVPEHRVSVAVLLAGEEKDVNAVAQDLLTAVRPLL